MSLTQLCLTIKFERRYELALVDCIIKNIYAILRKDRTYDIKGIPYYWPLVSEEWKESMNSCEHAFIALPHKDYSSKIDLCRAINRRIMVRKNGAFHFNF